jgi:hypothetical protein
LKKWLIIGAVVVLVLTVGSLWLFVAQGWLDEVRDIAIIILAFFHLISILLLVAVLAALAVAIGELKRLTSETITPKVSALLDSVKETTNSVKETAYNAKQTSSYVTEGVVSPFIKLASLAAGVRAGARALAQRRAQSDQTREVAE